MLLVYKVMKYISKILELNRGVKHKQSLLFKNLVFFSAISAWNNCFIFNGYTKIPNVKELCNAQKPNM